MQNDTPKAKVVIVHMDSNTVRRQLGSSSTLNFGHLLQFTSNMYQLQFYKYISFIILNCIDTSLHQRRFGNKRIQNNNTNSNAKLPIPNQLPTKLMISVSYFLLSNNKINVKWQCVETCQPNCKLKQK